MSNKAIAEFLEHHKQFSHFRPASREEAGLFYSEPDQALDEALGTVGHLRIDFGSGGKGFFHTWWPHNEDQFNTEEFKDDLQGVVDALRADGPLKDLSEMSTYCHQNGGAITQDGRSYGYIAETKHYRYCLRCTPSPGDYQGYLYCYDLRQQQMAHQNKPIGRVTFASGEQMEYLPGSSARKRNHIRNGAAVSHRQSDAPCRGHLLCGGYYSERQPAGVLHGSIVQCG